MWETIQPMLAELLTLIIIALIGYAVKLLKAWLLENNKARQFTQAYAAAEGLWIYLEEYVPKLVGQSKMDEMKAMLHIDFPLLSDAQLTAINKEIHLRMDGLYKQLNNTSMGE